MAELDPPERRQRPRQRFDWAGATALVIGTCLAGSWAAALIIEALANTPVLSMSANRLLSGIGQVLAGAVSTYIGARVGYHAGRQAPRR